MCCQFMALCPGLIFPPPISPQGLPESLLMAEIMAYQGRYQDAARLYTQSGAVDKAMEMFSDLRQFDEAKKWAEEYGRTRGENAQVRGGRALSCQV